MLRNTMPNTKPNEAHIQFEYDPWRPVYDC